ncbi:hypothetical protein Tco_1034215, partial [Tanacetum coccineum]
YVVPTGRVVVPTGRYVVLAGKVIIIVSPGRLNLVPTGRIFSPGKWDPTPTDSFSPSSIPVKDRDSLMEEIDIFLDGDDSIPSGIESDDFDSEDDDNYTSRPEFGSFHVDYPDSGDSTIDVVDDIPVDAPNILPTHPALQLDFDFIPSYNDLGSDLDN